MTGSTFGHTVHTILPVCLPRDARHKTTTEILALCCADKLFATTPEQRAEVLSRYLDSLRCENTVMTPAEAVMRYQSDVTQDTDDSDYLTTMRHLYRCSYSVVVLMFRSSRVVLHDWIAGASIQCGMKSLVLSGYTCPWCEVNPVVMDKKFVAGTKTDDTTPSMFCANSRCGYAVFADDNIVAATR